MKYFIEKIYLVLFLITIFLFNTEAFCKEGKIKYSKDNISNYLSGITSVRQNYTDEAFYYLNKVQSLKNSHTNFNIQFIHTLILLEKFKQAFAFSKSVWTNDEFIFETDLLLGLDYFINKDYVNAEKHFERLNKISQYNLIFDNFFGNVFMAWTRALQGNKVESFKFLEKIPSPYHHLKNIQNG